jgi:hypothetical protein
MRSTTGDGFDRGIDSDAPAKRYHITESAFQSDRNHVKVSRYLDMALCTLLSEGSEGVNDIQCTWWLL